MINYNIFILALETLRTNKGYTINDFVSGIISRRTYARLLSEDANISIETLTQLLVRLDMNLEEFNEYLKNLSITKNPLEYEFVNKMLTRHFSEANDIYKEIENLENLESSFKKYTIPLSSHFLSYRNGIINYETLLDRVNGIFNIDEILLTPIVTDDVVVSLCIYSYFCEESSKLKLINYLLKIARNDGVEMLSAFTYYIKATIDICLIQLLSSLKNTNNNTKKLFVDISNEYYFLYIQKYNYFDLIFYFNLYTYWKNKKIINMDVIYLYISCLLSYDKSIYPEDIKFTYSKEDIEIYGTLLKENKDLNELKKGIIIYD